MTRHFLFRVLLSLLLLGSQHLASAHVLSHLSSSLGRMEQADDASSHERQGALAQDQSCHKCLAFAQLGGPLGAAYFAFPLPECTSAPVFGADIAAAHARTILAFQSRGPPHA